MRWLASRLLLGLAVAAATLPTPAEAACRREPDRVHFLDRNNGNTITYLVGEQRLEFTLADGRKLIGQPARAVRSRGGLQVAYRSASLTLTLNTQLAKGRARASAVERLPGYDPITLDRDANGRPRRVGAADEPTRRTHLLTVVGGPAQGFACVASPGSPPARRAR